MKAYLLSSKKETKDVYTFIFKPESKINFKPGQFLMVGVEKKDGNNNLTVSKRAYSIASSPLNENIILTLKIYPKGVVSPILVNLKPNDRVELLGPYGYFIYEENNYDLALIAAGTGIAPIMGILSYVLEKNLPVNIHLLYSCKESSDIIFKNELLHLSKKHKNFNYIQTITRENNHNNKNGRIDKEFILSNLDNLNKLFYICGPPDMVKDVEKILLELNVKKELIKTERF